MTLDHIFLLIFVSRWSLANAKPWTNCAKRWSTWSRRDQPPPATSSSCSSRWCCWRSSWPRSGPATPSTRTSSSTWTCRADTTTPTSSSKRRRPTMRRTRRSSRAKSPIWRCSGRLVAYWIWVMTCSQIKHALDSHTCVYWLLINWIIWMMNLKWIHVYSLYYSTCISKSFINNWFRFEALCFEIYLYSSINFEINRIFNWITINFVTK